jgi:hypothetical protein
LVEHGLAVRPKDDVLDVEVRNGPIDGNQETHSNESGLELQTWHFLSVVLRGDSSLAGNKCREPGRCNEVGGSSIA